MLSRTIFQTALRALPCLRVASHFGAPAVKLSSPYITSNSQFHSSAISLGKIKTKSTAAKRFIKTGKGILFHLKDVFLMKKIKGSY